LMFSCCLIQIWNQELTWREGGLWEITYRDEKELRLTATKFVKSACIVTTWTISENLVMCKLELVTCIADMYMSGTRLLGIGVGCSWGTNTQRSMSQA
jgi:hypothetical protein